MLSLTLFKVLASKYI